MKIAVTHKNPDFDAFASAYAAVLYHDLDYVLTASSYETSVKEFLSSEEIGVPIRHLKEKEISEIDEVELLVITDCKMAKRLGNLEGLVEKAKKVIVYDHHPLSADDVEAEMNIEEVGSATTIVVHKLREKGEMLTPMDATFLMCGIYEDTGMMTFSGTTVKDMEAAAWLLSMGADVQLVSDYVKREMSREHVFILNELLTNMNLIRIGAISIGVSEAGFDSYVGDISSLGHRIMDMEGLDSLFMMVRTGDRVILVGRSRADEVNAAVVAYNFGGGGHPTAASAVIKNMTLHEALDKLNMILHEVVKPVKIASELMNFPVKTLKSDSTFNGAIDLFMKNNLNMMPVVDDRKPVGLVSRRDILQALKHGMHDEPISSIMQVEFRHVTSDTPYYDVEEIMLNGNQKMVTVVDDEKLVGVITRTDLLRMMHEEISKMPRYKDGRLMKSEVKRFKNIASGISAVLDERVVGILKDIGELADRAGFKCYLVGGVVRDILLRKTNEDIDIVVEGSAPDFASKFAKTYGARVAIHSKFKTAVVIFEDGFRVDFATSRTEYYNFPASAPTVEDASIRNDLFRRDFSINAMAVKLNRGEFGILLDFFGGQRDLSDKKIRVLHSLSFVDDPSRALRAIRFAVRFGFDIGPHTDKLFKHAVSLSLFDRVIGSRMFLELKYILSERNYKKSLEMMKRYDMLRFFHGTIQLNDTLMEELRYLEVITDWYSFQFDDEYESYLPRFILIFRHLDEKALDDILNRFNLDEKLTSKIKSSVSSSSDTYGRMMRHKDGRLSEKVRLMKRLNLESAMAVSALLGEEFEEFVKNYFSVYRDIKADINGNDLKELKIAPAKIYSKILDKLVDAKVDGVCEGEDAQRELALKLAEEMKEG